MDFRCKDDFLFFAQGSECGWLDDQTHCPPTPAGMIYSPFKDIHKWYESGEMLHRIASFTTHININDNMKERTVILNVLIQYNCLYESTVTCPCDFDKCATSSVPYRRS